MQTTRILSRGAELPGSLKDVHMREKLADYDRGRTLECIGPGRGCRRAGLLSGLHTQWHLTPAETFFFLSPGKMAVVLDQTTVSEALGAHSLT